MKYKAIPAILPDHDLILATIRRRSVAFLIDCILLILVYLCIILLFSLFDMHISKIDIHGIFEVEVEMENTPSFVITLLKLLFGLLPVFYFTLSFNRFRGQTLGKYLLRIRVLSLYHERLSWWHSLERSLGYFASALEFGFGFIQAFWNPNRMTLHDKIGETVIIKLPAKKRK